MEKSSVCYSYKLTTGCMLAGCNPSWPPAVSLVTAWSRHADWCDLALGRMAIHYLLDDSMGQLVRMVIWRLKDAVGQSVRQNVTSF